MWVMVNRGRERHRLLAMKLLANSDIEETPLDPNLLMGRSFIDNQNGTESLYLVPDRSKILCGAMIYVIFILSIIGNGLLFHALFRNMNVKNVTNMYFLHLACSDVPITIALPFTATGLINGWSFSELICKLVVSLYYSGMTSSIILLTAISVDQFSTVVIQNGCIVPVKRRRCAIGACTVTWMVSLAVVVPCPFYSKVVRLEDEAMCFSHQIHTFFSLLSICLFAVIVFCYSAILWTKVRASTRKKLRTASLALCISVAFFVCWAPHTILMKTSSKELDVKQTFAYHVTFIVSLSHCCINPMIYMMSPKYRKHVQSVFCCEKVHTKR
ncbi:C-C chemokine receptor type 8-like [Gadus macrocephalus]|uniref:C-C chemokine receptor type 8-like n=1 Tax=Gadus macrocephalus TaxID=80720 RepID=UPI0028CB35D4|nr:C-C chemokine receptor type 8-like [Gadus macrocephalus]